MAAHIEFGEVMPGSVPVYTRTPRSAESITTTTSTATTAEAVGGDYASVMAVGADIMVAIGSSPTAVAGGAGMRRVAAGSIRDFGPLKDGDKVAAIDAS